MNFFFPKSFVSGFGRQHHSPWDRCTLVVISAAVCRSTPRPDLVIVSSRWALHKMASSSRLPFETVGHWPGCPGIRSPDAQPRLPGTKFSSLIGGLVGFVNECFGGQVRSFCWRSLKAWIPLELLRLSNFRSYFIDSINGESSLLASSSFSTRYK